MRYEVVCDGTPEGLIANEWEIGPSGALVFYDTDPPFKTFVIAYAHAAWSSFYEASE